MSLKDKLHSLKEQYKGKKIAPAFNALHTFLYMPNETTHSGSHVRDAADLKRVMNTVIMALLPCLLFGMYNVGFQHYTQVAGAGNFSFMDAFTMGLFKVLPLVVVSYGVGLAVEFLFAVIKGHEVEEGFLVTGMLIPLIVPVDIPLWMLAIATVFGVVIGKEVFGGTGMNIFNPALIVRAFLFFAYPAYMSGDKIWVHDALNRSRQIAEGASVDAISGETILGTLAAEGAKASDVTYSVMDTFLGLIPGSVGETSVLAILLGAAFLIFSGVGSWRIMLSGVLGAGFMGFVFNQVGGTALFDFPWWEHLMVGGFAFGIVFMATDPVSAAQTDKGKWIYGFLIGVLSILIRAFNPAFPEGVMMAILLLNVFAPTIDHYVVAANKKKRQNRLKVKSA